MTDLPGWVLDLVAAVERHEDTHPALHRREECLITALAGVPDDVRAMARGWAQARRAEPTSGGTT